MLFKGNGIVWDGEKDKRLCAFNKASSLETEDPRVIKILKKLGYESSGSEGEPKTGKVKNK